MAKYARLKKEIQMLSTSPPPGIFCCAKDDKLDQLEAQIIGEVGTPYDKGTFKLKILLGDRYPFEPPNVTFVTPIYHPNIDDAGRICLDILKMPPKGAWRPSLNLGAVLSSVQLLMAEPNPDDPLMADIATEFKHNRPVFDRNASRHTTLHAMQDTNSKIEPVSEKGVDKRSHTPTQTEVETCGTTRKQLKEDIQ